MTSPSTPTGSAGFFAILIAISAIGPLALNIFVPSMPGLMEEFNASTGKVQLTLTLYLAGIAICQLFYGPLSDRFGRRPMVLAGMALFIASSVLAALSPSIELLIFARLIQAMGGAAGIVLARAIVRDLYSRDQAASVIGYITVAWVLAPMIAPALGGFIDHFASWRVNFWLLAGLGALTLFASWRLLPETHHDRTGGPVRILPTGFRRLMRIPAFRFHTLTLAAASGVFFSFLAGAPFLMVSVMGRTPVEYGLWFMLISLGYMTGNLLSGRLSQQLGTDRMIRLGNYATLIGAAVMAGFVAAGILTPVTLFGPMLLCTLGNGLTIPNGTAAAISVDPGKIGAAAGIAGCAQMGLGAVASQLVGMAQNQYQLAMFWLLASFAIIAAVSHQRYLARHPEPNPETAP